MGVKQSHPGSKIIPSWFVRDILGVEGKSMSKNTQSVLERYLVGRSATELRRYTHEVLNYTS